MKSIASRDNPGFKALRALAHDHRLQRASGRTVIEGPHLLTACLDHAGVPELLAVSESALGKPEVAALLARTAAVETIVLRDTLFHEISELATPLGILARIAIPPQPATHPLGDCLLLDAVQDAGNVGTLLRTAAAAGVHDVLLGTGCAGAWTPRVLRAGQGVHFALRIRERVDLANILQGYAGMSLAAVAHRGTSLYELDLNAPIAWLFGNEGAGIDPALLAAMQQRVTIPLAHGSESLNVAAAAAICLFEMRRQRVAN
ncbi:MAG: RNA methyltransferase [Rhodocyclaceae bacterium]|nr:RNA methyltransferase [Rhodocyclaceae bacterium]